MVANDQLTLNIGVVNGWDDLKDTNAAKTVELGVAFTPIKALSFAADGYRGKERVGGLTAVGPQGQRKLLDVIASWALTDALNVVLNFDWGRQDGYAPNGRGARWEGLAGYLNYAFSDHWRASLRSEYLNDRDGYRTFAAQKWRENTLTLAWMPAKSVEIRLEGRLDRSNQVVFVENGAYFMTNGNPALLGDQQGSMAVEGLYKF